MNADISVLIGCFMAGLFWLGLEIGQFTQPLLCPVVEGQQIVSTTTTKDGQHCTYSSSYGRATRKVKVKI